jgi:hypothetical protein
MFSGLLAVALVFFVSGCGDSPDSVMKDTIKYMNETADIFDGIKSKEDAEKAKPKLEAVNKKMKDLEERGKKLKMNELSEEKKKALGEKYGPDLLKASLRMMTAMGKVRKDPEVAAALKDLGFGPGLGGGFPGLGLGGNPTSPLRPTKSQPTEADQLPKSQAPQLPKGKEPPAPDDKKPQ